MEDELKALQWEHEVLEQRFEKIQSERDELYAKFVKVSAIQKKSVELALRMGNTTPSIHQPMTVALPI